MAGQVSSRSSELVGHEQGIGRVVSVKESSSVTLLSVLERHPACWMLWP